MLTTIEVIKRWPGLSEGTREVSRSTSSPGSLPWCQNPVGALGVRPCFLPTRWVVFPHGLPNARQHRGMRGHSGLGPVMTLLPRPGESGAQGTASGGPQNLRQQFLQPVSPLRVQVHRVADPSL